MLSHPAFHPLQPLPTRALATPSGHGHGARQGAARSRCGRCCCALHHRALVAWAGHMHGRRRAIDGREAEHQSDSARTTIAVFAGIRAIAAVALPMAALHGMKRHPRTRHPVSTKGQHPQARITVQRQAQVAGPVDEVGADGAPSLPCIG